MTPEALEWMLDMAAALREDNDPKASAKAERASQRRLVRYASLTQQLTARGWVPGHRSGWSAAEVEETAYLLIDAGLRDNLALAFVACEILTVEHPDTVRGTMYQIVSAAGGWLENTGDACYNRIQRLLVGLRKKGVISYSWIVDNVRETIKPSSWSGLGDFGETVRSAYRLDFWKSLPIYVCVIVEKDTVAGKVESVTREFDVSLHALRGYASASFAFEIGSSWRNIQKPIEVIYIGDHDPSGRDLERNIRAELAAHSGREFSWTRLAIDPYQYKEFNVVPLEAKVSDKRHPWFIANFNAECAEVEAIPASALRSLLRTEIETHIPRGEWERLQQIEAAEKASFVEFLDKFPKRGAA